MKEHVGTKCKPRRKSCKNCANNDGNFKKDKCKYCYPCFSNWEWKRKEISSRYKLPLEEAKILAVGQKRALRSLVGSAIADFNKVHPEWKIENGQQSLHKRIVGKVYDYFLRASADRVMLSWLERNRHRFSEIQEIRGSLRKVVSDLMLEEKEKEQNENIS